jgi:ribonuclease H / adenosylcobalamin/alpha-ribazole phosphatase
VTRLIIEADGGSRGNPGPAAYGAVVLDDESGRVLVELADHIGTDTNNVAEYRGLTAGLEAVRRLDPTAEVEARLDSKLVVQQMSGGWAIRNDRLRRLALAAKALLPAEQVRYTWVPRAQNKRADSLVNRSLDAHAAGRPARIEIWHPAGGSGGDGEVVVDEVDAVALAGTPDEESLEEAPVIVGWSRADLGEPTTLLLVRHGVTQHSVEHRFSGRNGQDPPLIDQGRAQSAAVAEELARRGGADRVVTSPLLRTRQTAEIVSEHLGLPAPEVHPELAEADFGRWDSLTFSEVNDLSPGRLKAWLASPDLPPPGGESYTAVAQRVAVGLSALLERYAGRRVVVVSHTTPIKCMVQSVLRTPSASAYRFELAPCSLTTVGAWRDGVSTVMGLGEIGHLHGVMHETA